MASLLPREIVNKHGGTEVSTVGGALDLVTKMAVYRLMRAVIFRINLKCLNIHIPEGVRILANCCVHTSIWVLLNET